MEDRYLLHALFNGPDIGVCPRFTKKLILRTDRMLPRQTYLMLTLYTAKLWQFGQDFYLLLIATYAEPRISSGLCLTVSPIVRRNM